MIKYINKNVAILYVLANPEKKVELLWGDQFRITGGPDDGYYTGFARGVAGRVKSIDLGDESLLEFYFIDVGQGDGVLVRTPDGRHILVDGGYPRKSQPSGKNAADFVDWKFKKDYGKDTIVIDAMISSHCDSDHYGGLWDLINPNETHELDIDEVQIKKYYHAGISWWKSPTGARSTGKVENGLITTLLENEDHIGEALESDADWKLQGEWRDFMELIYKQHIPVKRIYHEEGGDIKSFPEFDSEVDIKVLGPVQLTKNGSKGYKDLGDDSQNTNGHSITLRVDYGNFRLLLTGDLNANSQRVLLESHVGNKLAFQADVAKSCHHGSDDCSLEFLQHVHAGATVISSGDSEKHDHPRPAIVAASALTGFQQIKDDKLITPLVYSTEISRSYKLGRAYQVDIDGVSYNDMSKVDVKINETDAGDLNPKTKIRRLDKAYIVSGIVYGLVNVRTDGKKIVCATMNEKVNKWEIKAFESRF
jgi:beta-lactamase superfamily II metal-dependent hydrolase